MSRPALVGAAALPVRRNLEKPVRDAATEVALAALADAGISPAEVDGLVVTPACLSGPPSFMWCCSLGHHLGLRTRAQVTTECGGMTAALALKAAADEVRLDRCRCVLVIATDMRVPEPHGDLTVYASNMTERLLGIYGPTDGVYGLAAPIPYYAMSAQRYMHEHDVTEEDLARVAVTLRQRAVSNPIAQYREPMTIADVLASRPVCPPLKLLDCSPFASGAAAVVVASEELAYQAPKQPVFIVGTGEHHEPALFGATRGPLDRFVSAEMASALAFDAANRKRGDVDVAELYGVFTATELMLYEDLGFFHKGRAARAVREGLTSGAGRTVMNPSGGRLSVGHPAGVTPLLSAVELVWQLRGEAGARQVPKAKTGLLHAEHGMLDGSFVAILEAA